MNLRLVVILAFVPFISGWFCVYIPMGLFDRGNSCVSDTAYVGQRIQNPSTGKVGVVRELQGRSERCQTAVHPIKAIVDFE